MKLKIIKVLHINTFDRGGAAIACTRLHESLLELGVQSRLLLRTQTKEIKNSALCPKKAEPKPNIQDKIFVKIQRIGREFKLIPPKKKVISEENKFLSLRPKGLEYFSFPYSDYDITNSELYKEADIIHLHWVADFLDWETFFSKNTKPIVWTLHDQNPYLGGEHYSERYFGINKDGYPKKRELSEFEILEEARLLEIKLRSLKKERNINVVSTTYWNKTLSQKSILFGKFPHFLIPCGFSDSDFKRLNEIYCKELFGLPAEKRIILFGADSVTNKRKGFEYIVEALKYLESEPELVLENVIFCAFGKGNFENNKIRFLGSIDDSRLLCALFNSADLFVIPSLEEAFGMVTVESMMCGTPVLGFPTGGIVDLIEDGVNGFLCEEISVNALVTGLKRFLSGEVVFDRHAISKTASERFSLEKQATAYIELYQDIMTQNGIKSK
jgi:glycosyltransferase involved in cell wall biosynthesis